MSWSTAPVRFGEVIPPGGPVRVIGTTHPLHAVAGARIMHDLEAGLTIAEMLEVARWAIGRAGMRVKNLGQR